MRRQAKKCKAPKTGQTPIQMVDELLLIIAEQKEEIAELKRARDFYRVTKG
jgi:hypothetical protein